MPSTDQILQLVRSALDEFDDRPLDASVRRVVRIASLLGESEVAVRLGLELKPTGGHPPANAADTRRLLADPESWGDPSGAAERAVTEYMAERQTDAGKVWAWSLAELAFWDRTRSTTNVDEMGGTQYGEFLETELARLGITERARHRAFTLLCAWERQLNYTNTNERIFSRFQRVIDAMLAHGAPDVLEQFNAVYRRLADAAQDGLDDASEELSQALTSCRRILKAVADHVQPPLHGAQTPAGHSLDDQHYRNRLREFIKVASRGDRADAALTALVAGV